MYGGTRTGVNTDAALKWYLSKGATPQKLVVGKCEVSTGIVLVINFIQASLSTVVHLRTRTASGNHTPE